MPVQLQLQYVESVADKMNAADLSGDVCAMLVSVTRTLKL